MQKKFLSILKVNDFNGEINSLDIKIYISLGITLRFKNDFLKSNQLFYEALDLIKKNPNFHFDSELENIITLNMAVNYLSFLDRHSPSTYPTYFISKIERLYIHYLNIQNN